MSKGIIVIVRAVIVRLVMAVHNILSAYMLADRKSDAMCWLVLLPFVPFIIEIIIRFRKNKGEESKWFFPCILFFLCSSVPSVWLLELNRLVPSASNITQSEEAKLNGTTDIIETLKGLIDDDDAWVSILEQSLLYIMIVGRWLLPRGNNVSRDDLSQLLILYISMASDITELFALMDMITVRENTVLAYVILTMWSASLVQFTINFTARTDNGCCRNEIWGIVLTIILQDVPFLLIRLFIIIEYGIVTYSIVAFSIKNVILLFFLMYRIHVVKVHIDEEEYF